jgi:hypothetical protein
VPAGRAVELVVEQHQVGRIPLAVEVGPDDFAGAARSFDIYVQSFGEVFEAGSCRELGRRFRDTDRTHLAVPAERSLELS